MSWIALAIWAGVTAAADAVAAVLPDGTAKRVLNVVGSIGPGAIVSAVQSARGK
jgi:hypothetical protein